jgi:hypothetical protein
MIIICVGGSSGEDKEGDKHDLELAQSFTEVQDAYEMLTHSFKAQH